MSPSHVHIVGDLARQRLAAAELVERPQLVVHCHRNRRGPYTGVDTFIRELLVEAIWKRPDLIEEFRLVLLYGMPELADVIGPAPRDMAASSDFAERTRFYGASMIRCMSQGIVTFVKRYTADSPGRVVLFDGVQDAARTTQQFLALLIRRIPAEQLTVVVGSTGTVLEELGGALERHATHRLAPNSLTAPEASPADLAARYVASDGTDDEPACLAAYQALSDAQRAALHDHRADEIEQNATWSIRVGALPYHRERGSDPSGAGSAALAHATQLCTEAGFSEMTVEFGYRGRAVTDPRDEVTFRKLTIQVSSALIPCGRLSEAMDLLHDLRRRYPSPLTHMTTSYSLAMMYTRFLTPRDHEQAVEWENNAIAIASILPDEDERLMFTGFQDNAMALIEMHRGNLDRALKLVEGALYRADTRMESDAYRLHRSQLLYNRARLLAGLGRKDEAYQIFTVLSELDPHYTDYLSERAKISRRRGDLTAALADYDRAVRLGPPFHELLYNRGSARMEAGDLVGALADFDLVLDMEPTDLETRVIRAELHLAEDRPAAATADIDAGLALRPDDARLLCLRGMLQLAEHPEAAIADFTAALSLDSNYPAALVNRAVALFQIGDAGSSIEDLSRALEITGDDPDLLLNRGLARAAVGDLQAAVADFDRALALPDADVAELQFQREACLLGAGNANSD
ncbi:MAG TPA: tetratricopeptide repeat protein [Jatrophihabitans sp.]|nr:tetratricopeptide repeat protein [Jatrophihabitans sp.]